MGVALSGAGPAVLLLVESPQAASAPELHARIHTLAEEPVELLVCGLVSDREAAS
jgi:homoserine kinase